ncbi:hypothetical protein B0F87_10733 [Methylobacter tundripaludum]|uniref:Uncharacterized protein n=1 Tax=Methylobacter tundripaludum TaxID=173365 RepID=A0A2S6HBF5_9GAMM|nr:hypothetical protein B0F87_10733 [Methylobacter tundripaludum]
MLLPNPAAPYFYDIKSAIHGVWIPAFPAGMTTLNNN